MYETVIIGAGAAGLSAAMYAVRRSLKTLLLSIDIGGQTATTPAIENYPGYSSIDGLELMMKFKEQAERFGAEIKLEEVTAVEPQADGTFVVRTANAAYPTRTVIFSHGLEHRKLDVPGEEQFSGKGVSYCATCDAPLFRGKITAVIGGGSSALDAALLLGKLCPKVYLIHRRDRFTAEDILVHRLKEAANVDVRFNTVVKEIRGEGTVRSIVLESTDRPGETSTLDVGGVFVEIGFKVDERLFRDLVAQTPQKAIVIDRECRTNIPGIFAAGDVTTVKYKQTVIAAGEGATAALEAYAYILKQQGRTPSSEPDRTTHEDVLKKMAEQETAKT